MEPVGRINTTKPITAVKTFAEPFRKDDVDPSVMCLGGDYGLLYSRMGRTTLHLANHSLCDIRRHSSSASYADRDDRLAAHRHRHQYNSMGDFGDHGHQN